MKILNLFRKSSKKSSNSEQTENKKIIYLEDSFCQVELVPVENKLFILNQMSKIENTVGNINSEYGYIECIQRESEPITVKSKNIQFKDVLETIGAELELNECVYCAIGSSFQLSESTVAFGFDSLNVMVTRKSNTVEHLWINGYTKSFAEAEKLAYVVNKLCNEYRLAVCDWDACELIESSDTESMKQYMNGYVIMS